MPVFSTVFTVLSHLSVCVLYCIALYSFTLVYLFSTVLLCNSSSECLSTLLYCTVILHLGVCALNCIVLYSLSWVSVFSTLLYCTPSPSCLCSLLYCTVFPRLGVCVLYFFCTVLLHLDVCVLYCIAMYSLTRVSVFSTVLHCTP